MKYKDDWPESSARLSKLWNGDSLDRPCIAVTAPAEKPIETPGLPENMEDRWLAPEWVLAQMKAQLVNTWWGGESVPSYLLMGGWVASLGGIPDFRPNTIWFEHTPVDFTKPSPFKHESSDPWVQRVIHLTLAAAEFAGFDDFLIGQPNLLPANDLLSMHMGADEFLVNLIQEPEWMKEAIIEGAKGILQGFDEIMGALKNVHKFWYGNAGWMPFWAPEPYLATQSDVSCMLSPEMFLEFVIPELDILGNRYGNLWYHLDGATATQHLETLLSLPYLKVLQYTPSANVEPSNGVEHIDLYRKAQSAGKIVHIQLPCQNIEPLLKQGIDPQLVMFQTNCRTIEDARELLEQSRTWT